VQGQKRNWLTDDGTEGFLPRTLPTARVMIFGYNSNAVFEGSDATVNEHAENLLVFLRQERRRVSYSPQVTCGCTILSNIQAPANMSIAQDSKETYNFHLPQPWWVVSQKSAKILSFHIRHTVLISVLRL
jgi:hypothetical protein